MPTPNDETLHIPSVGDPHVERPTHTTCPPDAERVNVWRIQDDDVIDREDSSVEATAHGMQQTPSPNASESGPADPQDTQQSYTKQMDLEDPASSPDGMSLWGLAPEPKDSEQRLSPVPTSPPAAAHSSSSSMRHEFSNIRVRALRTVPSRYDGNSWLMAS